jgi:dihydrofolate synthase/folylpolyglutamate synthase
MKYLLECLGNPQNSYKIIHIAGDAGKGSTAYILNSLLQNHNYSVGLHVSPHLLDLRERFQINGKLVSHKQVMDAVAYMIPAVTSCTRSFF